ncbi:hypothetical protein BGW41_005742 [Actinomortierella wolfii]|nr:hypothetical protein BGW41_005742 [Actinomortierella wolfii]
MPALVLAHQQPGELPSPSSRARRRSSVLLEKHLVTQRRSSFATPPAAPHSLPAGGNFACLQISEIADKIAGYLDRGTLCSTARVSRQWHAVSMRHLWRKTHLDRSNPSKEAVQLINFPALASYVRHLTLSGYGNPVHHPLSLAAPATLHFHSLKIFRCSELDAEALYDILDHSVNHLGQLQLLDVSSLRSNPFVSSSPSTFKHLEQFTLVMTAEGGGDSPPVNSNSNVSQPSNETGLTDEVLTGTTSGAVTAVTPAHQAETELDDNHPGSQQQPETVVLYTDHLAGFLDKAPSIRSLTAQGIASSYATHAGMAISPILRPHLSLTNLDLHDSIVSGATLGQLLAKCPNLASLSISHTNNTHFLTGLVIPKCTTARHLKTLLMQGCFFTDGHGFKELFRFACHVEKLDISRSNVNDEDLAVLGHNMASSLQDLNLQGCQEITDEGIRELLARRLGEKLQHLVLAECTELTGRSVHNVLHSCSQLVSLDISQPDILPLSMFHLEQEDDDDEEGGEEGIESLQQQGQQEDAETSDANPAATVNSTDAAVATEAEHIPWACKNTLEWLRIKKLDVLEQRHLTMLKNHLHDLEHLRALHIGGSKLELSVLDGMGQRSIRLQQLFIDELVRDVTMEDLQHLRTENTPHLVRLWCRNLTRFSEPWLKLREERPNLKMW